MVKYWVLVMALLLAACAEPPGDGRMGMLSGEISATTIKGMRNLSGITRHDDSGRLWMVSNNPMMLYEAGLDGHVLRSVALYAFADPEDLVWLKDNRFAIVEERAHRISIIDIPADVDRVHQSMSVRVIDLPPVGENNKGYEGLAYDRARDILFVAKESGPDHILVFAGTHHDVIPQVSVFPYTVPAGDDVAGIYFDHEHQSLLVLHERSRVLVEVDMSGRVLQRLKLGDWWWGIRQPEGITVGPFGQVFVVGEPNRFYRFHLQ
ncbi:MAG: hypothetical protein EP312_09500 [Gammaproteobacteria bacterium]|nr:MAG: hypothetical protein EP312_09500 [Gammaproteobacteria bacterium]